MADYLAKGLKEEGYVVDQSANGRDGLLRAASGSYDLLIVDRMLPELDGLAVVSTLRASGNRVPVLILSALGEVDERIRGLRAGGDDYLTKPFSFGEMTARLEALLRRGSAAPRETVLRVGDLKMDLVARRVTRQGREIHLQPQEWRLLEYLMRHAGRVLSRTMIFENVWDYNFDPQTNVIDVHIGRLRKKIDRDFKYTLLQTVRGVGYVIRVPD